MPETIYLLPNEGFDGETVWCDDIPTEEHEADAVQYTRTDKYEALQKDSMECFRKLTAANLKIMDLQQSHDRLVCGIRRSIQLLSNRGYQKEASELLDLLPDEDQKESE